MAADQTSLVVTPEEVKSVYQSRGGYRPGAGVKSKASKSEALETAIELLELQLPKNINFLKRVRDNDKALQKIYGDIPLNIRLKAAQILIDKAIPDRDKIIIQNEGDTKGNINIYYIPGFSRGGLNGR